MMRLKIMILYALKRLQGHKNLISDFKFKFLLEILESKQFPHDKFSSELKFRRNDYPKCRSMKFFRVNVV